MWSQKDTCYSRSDETLQIWRKHQVTAPIRLNVGNGLWKWDISSVCALEDLPQGFTAQVSLRGRPFILNKSAQNDSCLIHSGASNLKSLAAACEESVKRKVVRL